MYEVVFFCTPRNESVLFSSCVQLCEGAPKNALYSIEKRERKVSSSGARRLVEQTNVNGWHIALKKQKNF